MNSTIAAISTANAVSAIAMIRLSGAQAVTIANSVFKPVSGRALTELSGYQAAYGSFVFEGQTLDDGVVIVYHAPKSYTGEMMAELCCHGNPVITKKLLTACIAAGARPAAAGEFTKRAFLNGKLDLTQAEAVTELINAESEAAVRQALLRREGALGRQISAVSSQLTLILATLCVWADFPDEEDFPIVTAQTLEAQIKEAQATLQPLIEGHKTGLLIDKGIAVAVAGSPNVGKSTLSNLLWERDRSIVTDIAGTTRDVVEAELFVQGVKLRLLDTAGIRETDDVVEKIGVERSKSAIEAADLVLFLVDGAQGATEQDIALFQSISGKPCIVVANKADLATYPLPAVFGDAITLSAQTGAGVEALKSLISERLGLSLNQDTALIASQRQFDCVLRCQTALDEAAAAVHSGVTLDAVGILLDQAAAALLELTGESVTEAVTDKVFATFCVGK